MKTRKYNGVRKKERTRRGQKRYGNKHIKRTTGNKRNRRKGRNNTIRHRRNTYKPKRQKGGGIPLGPIVTIGVLALAAIVGPIAGAYLDQSDMEKAKREADDIMKEKAAGLKGERDFFGQQRTNPGERGEKEENDNDFADEYDEEEYRTTLSPGGQDRINKTLGQRARKQTERMIKGSPYWDTSTGVAESISA